MATNSPGNGKKLLTLSVPESFIDLIDYRAKKLRWSRNQFTRAIIEKWILRGARSIVKHEIPDSILHTRDNQELIRLIDNAQSFCDISDDQPVDMQAELHSELDRTFKDTISPNTKVAEDQADYTSPTLIPDQPETDEQKKRAKAKKPAAKTSKKKAG